MPGLSARVAELGFVEITRFVSRTLSEPNMPKQKTHKGMKKRFTVTANGKAKHRKAFRGHLLSGKSGNRKRHLRQDGVLANYQADRVVEGLRPIL